MVLLVKGKVRKLGLKLRIEKTKVATLKGWQKVQENCRKNTFLDNFFKKPRKARFVLKKWAYFSSKWAGLK